MADIAMQIDIAAEPAAVYRALTTTEGVAGWWTTKNETAATVGQVDRYWFPGVPTPYEMRVRKAEPDAALAWECVAGPPTWIGTTVRWRLTPGPGDGTLLVFDHAGFAEVHAMYRIVTLGWAQMILRLKEYLETGRPVPFFTV